MSNNKFRHQFFAERLLLISHYFPAVSETASLS